MSKLNKPRITFKNLAYITTEKVFFDDGTIFVEWLTDERGLRLISSQDHSIIPSFHQPDSHHCKSLTCREQGLNLHRT